MNVIGMNEIRRFYERERAAFDATGGDDQKEYEIQVSLAAGRDGTS